MAVVRWDLYQAALFDLDGVLTDTARIHARAWKETFDELLGVAGQPHFTIESDYRRFVDGRPRYQGVATFLASRGISLPFGDPEDHPDEETICGVGNRKNELVNQLITDEGVLVYPGSRQLLEYLEGKLKMAVVTSSANAKMVLAGAVLDRFFEVVVDGQLAAELGLAGKPDPDPFLKAAELLGVEPARAVVIEDAASGVAAGKAGGFGLVIGVNRHDDAGALREAGAGLVVPDLALLAG